MLDSTEVLRGCGHGRLVTQVDVQCRLVTALATRIQGITPKVLAETLRALEEDGLISRTVFDENPPHVEYALTELGRSLLVPLRAVRKWAEEHVPQVLASRAAPRPTNDE